MGADGEDERWGSANARFYAMRTNFLQFNGAIGGQVGHVGESRKAVKSSSTDEESALARLQANTPCSK